MDFGVFAMFNKLVEYMRRLSGGNVWLSSQNFQILWLNIGEWKLRIITFSEISLKLCLTGQ